MKRPILPINSFWPERFSGNGLYYYVQHWQIIFPLLLFTISACTQPIDVYKRESYVFGTRVEILVAATAAVSEKKAQIAIAEVLAEFDRLHREFHAWQPSQLTVLNNAIEKGKTAKVSAELAQLLRTAQAATIASDGDFDTGIGRYIALWGFESDTRAEHPPNAQELAALVLHRPSILDLQFLPTPNSETNGEIMVVSRNRFVAVDFGGYLKGIALDRARDIMQRNDIPNALVNIGGNVLAIGKKGDLPWRVGIQHPRSAQTIATLDLASGEAIGTSGDYQRYFEYEGQRYCHIIDPSTGAPASATQSLTVLIAPQPDAGTLSDWQSKPLFIAGAQWRSVAEKLQVRQVMRIDKDGKVETTEAMAKRLKWSAKDAP